MKDKAREWLMAVPNAGKLFWRLARDSRVPKKNKIFFGVVAGYLLVPIDVIPDWFPWIGQFDDLVLVVLALDAMLNRVPEEIVREHWEGDPAVLATIRSSLGTVTSFLPARFKRLLSE